MLLLEHATGGNMDADGFSIVDNRAGVTFGVELYVPWDAPEMAINHRALLCHYEIFVFGMSGRRDSVTESRILQGRDARSVQVLDPDFRGLDRNFYDVTIVDMGDLTGLHTGGIGPDEQLASSGDYAHAVATARVGRVETGGQGAIPEETASGVRVLWHHDQV